MAKLVGFPKVTGYILAGIFLNPGLFEIIPAALFLGSLASPTDPTATLAVKTEYNVKGPVMSAIMGVTAFDDVLGIINYSLATAVAVALINSQPMTASTLVAPNVVLGATVIHELLGPPVTKMSLKRAGEISIK